MAKPGFYAVQHGRCPGIYRTWEECEAQVKGFTGAKYKKFSTQAEAAAFAGGSAPAPVQPVHTPSPVARSLVAAAPAARTGSAPVPADEAGWDVVYTDGACKGNGQVGSIAGIGVWWGWDDPRNLAERCPGDQTNNRAELIAIIRALETTPAGTTPLLIKTDSKYSIQCVDVWIHSWQQRGWRNAAGQAVKNQGIIRYLSRLLAARAARGQKVRLAHVRGHVGIEGNEGADALANQGAGLPPVPERDWAALEAACDTAPVRPEALASAVEFEILESDLLSDEELAEMSRTQVFD